MLLLQREREELKRKYEEEQGSNPSELCGTLSNTQQPLSDGKRLKTPQALLPLAIKREGTL